MTKTPIEWADFTVNPFRFRNLKTGKVGHHCTKISPGCKNCYSGKMQTGPYLSGLAFIEENKPKGEFFLDERALEQVLRRKKPARIFWCDMTDMFLEDYPDEWIDRCFAVMVLTPQHTHQVLTKRAERMQYVMTKVIQTQKFWPMPNVWLGVSVENQQYADERIPHLLRTPAAIRFVSHEPALGPVDFGNYGDESLECNYCMRWRGSEDEAIPDGKEDDPGFLCPKCGEACSHLPLDERLDWIIVGGESGPAARPFDLAWARQTISQCKAAGVACFVKQLGSDPREGSANGNCRNMDCTHPDCGYIRHELNDSKGGDMAEWPADLRVREFPEVRR